MFVRSCRLALCALVLLAVTASSLTFAAPSQAILSGQAPRTIGLEVIVGLTDDVSHRIAHGAVEEIEAGRELRAGSRSDALLEGFGVRIVPVDVGAAADWLVLAHWFCGDEPWSAVQVLWPDRSGVFPGEDGLRRQFLARKRAFPGDRCASRAASTDSRTRVRTLTRREPPAPRRPPPHGVASAPTWTSSPTCSSCA